MIGTLPDDVVTEEHLAEAVHPSRDERTIVVS